MAFELSSEDLKSFHGLERELYTRLVTMLRLSPDEARRVIAFWLWLEKMGLPSMTMMLSASPDIVVSLAATEALSCLVCLKVENLSEKGSSNSIPITSRILGGSVSLRFLHKNRRFALDSIMMIMRDAANLQIISSTEESRPSGSNYMNLQFGGRPFLASSQTPYMNLSLQPSFQPPLQFKGIAPVPTGRQPLLPTPPFPRHGVQRITGKPNFAIGESSSSSRSISTRRNNRVDPPAERTMFMTFSRGYEVSEDELRGYIFGTYGDVVEDIIMESVPPGKQPLYAKVVFRSPATVDVILAGRDYRKFVIDGKHVRCRRWEPRH